MSRFYAEGDLLGFGYGSNFNNPLFISNLSKLRASLFTINPSSATVVSSDTNRRKRKVATFLSGEYPDGNVPLTKKPKLCPTLSDEGSSCLDEEEDDERSCITDVSRVSVPPKSVEQLRLEKETQRQKEDAARALENAKKPAISLEVNARAAMLRCRYAETILKAQQKLGLNEPVDVKRYKLDAKVQLRREVQKQREVARKRLEEVKKSVDVQDSFQVLRDFKALIGCSSASNSFQDRVHRPIQAPRILNCR